MTSIQSKLLGFSPWRMSRVPSFSVRVPSGFFFLLEWGVALFGLCRLCYFLRTPNPVDSKSSSRSLASVSPLESLPSLNDVNFPLTLKWDPGRRQRGDRGIVWVLIFLKGWDLVSELDLVILWHANDLPEASGVWWLEWLVWMGSTKEMRVLVMGQYVRLRNQVVQGFSLVFQSS